MGHLVKKLLRTLFSFLFNIFESGTGEYEYKTSHRVILAIIGGLFLALASLVLFLLPADMSGYLFPVIIFGGIGFICLLVAYAGTERAVARIWSAGR